MKGVSAYDNHCISNSGLHDASHNLYSRSSLYPLTSCVPIPSVSPMCSRQRLSPETTRLIYCSGGGDNSDTRFSTTKNDSQSIDNNIGIESKNSDDIITFEDISNQRTLYYSDTETKDASRTNDQKSKFTRRRNVIMTATGGSDMDPNDILKKNDGQFSSEMNTYYEDSKKDDNQPLFLSSGGAISTNNIQKEKSSKSLINYNNLPQALLGDTCSALMASFLVSPMVCAVDKSIMQQAAGTMSIPASMANSFKEMIIRPGAFFRRPEFLMIWGVYALTYITANYINTFCELRKVGAEIPRFLGTTVVNMSSCIAKDYAFVRMFGSGIPKPLSLTTLSLFTVRDSLTVLASFNLPEPASIYMQRAYNFTPLTADNIAQLTCPIAVQIFSTPLHLYGLDLYNRPKASFGDRVKMVIDNYRGAAMARMMRILPAFGIGGIGNKYFRNISRSYLKK